MEKTRSLYFDTFSWKFLGGKSKRLLDIAIWISREGAELQIIDLEIVDLESYN